ncbi:MAG: hypothetical protein OXU45_03945 [Candidatus Melainabacteria bacterium]|nr:hypothetical protein [Candidatus Melainabacteria bacterium]
MTDINTNNVYGRKIANPSWEKVARTAYKQQTAKADAASETQKKSAVDRVELSQQFIEMQRANSVTYDFGDFS